MRYFRRALIIISKQYFGLRKFIMLFNNYVCPGKKSEIFKKEEDYLRHIRTCYFMQTFKDIY